MERNKLSHKKYWKKFESNNKSIALNILYVSHHTEKIRHTDGKKEHYLAVKSLSSLFRGITSNHKEDFYCLNCFYSYSTDNKLKKHKNVYQNHDCCYVEMPKEDNKILKYDHGEKSMKVPFIIYPDLESLREKINTCHNNPKKLSTTKMFI